MKTLITTTLLSIIILLSSCKKEGPQGPTGPQGEKGDPGPAAITKEFNLTFDPGDTFETYNGFVGDYDAGDVILVYIYWADHGSKYYVQLPFTRGTVVNYAEVGHDHGLLIVNVENTTTGGSIITSTTTFGYKAVLIKSEIKRMMPKDFDYSNYENVVEFLEDQGLNTHN